MIIILFVYPFVRNFGTYKGEKAQVRTKGAHLRTKKGTGGNDKDTFVSEKGISLKKGHT